MIRENSSGLRKHDGLQFFLHWLRRPGRVGALVPSGPALAAALAAEIDIEAPGAVVELGAGTGRVTKALLQAGVAPDQLVVIERNPSFCKLLRERFPGTRIIAGEAQTLQTLLQRAGVGPVKAVASSLPLLSMTSRDRRAVLSEAAAVLGPDGVLVQYTYAPGAPVPAELGIELGMLGERTHWILANLPPAAVWRYRRCHSLAEATPVP